MLAQGVSLGRERPSPTASRSPLSHRARAGVRGLFGARKEEEETRFMALAVKEREDLYLKSFRELEKARTSSAPGWIKALRTAGMETFAELGFPTTHLKD